MKTHTVRLAAGLCLGMGAVALAAAAQTGSIDFSVRLTPASGNAEPVRGLSFSLLSRSFQEIQKEANAAVPTPELNAFIDKLEVSRQLKEWMKRAHSVQLSGEEFTRNLKVDDIMKVPEFFSAYLNRNAGDRSVDFPKPKFREKDKQKDPEKYEKMRQQYIDSIRKYLTSNPQTADGIEVDLTEIDPRTKWEKLNADRLPEIRRRTLHLAETKYLVARGETDLEGHAMLRGIPPGDYWLSSLEVEAAVGDVRVRWDTPVRVSAGGVTRLELSGSNAVEPRRPAR
jgi:hypothetical protein